MTALRRMQTKANDNKVYNVVISTQPSRCCERAKEAAREPVVSENFYLEAKQRISLSIHFQNIPICEVGGFFVFSSS